MKKDTSDRARAASERSARPVERVLQTAIAFGAAADAVTDAAAVALGINRTDMRVLSLLRIRGAQPVGRIAALTMLSPAAATAVVRRLVDAGFAVQASDPDDRRRSFVSLTPSAVERLNVLYGPMLERGRVWLARLGPSDLELLASFLGEAESLQLDLAADLVAIGRRSG